MSRIIIFILFFLFIPSVDSRADHPYVLVIQSLRISPYNEALAGFRAALEAKARGARYAVLRVNEADQAIRERKPDLILAIGTEALRKGKKYQHIPLIHLMVLNPHSILHNERNVTGVSMAISPEKQLQAIRKVLPDARRIGVIFDPDKSGAYVKKAMSSARALRMEIRPREVTSPREVADSLHAMKGTVDAIWMIPDTTAITPDTIETMMLFSVRNGIPVCSFSAKYVGAGALMSLDASPFDMGRQAGEMAARILSGARAADLQTAEVEHPVLTVNETVLRKLRLKMSDDVRARARIVR
ncbi:MAG: ABC transporter substrate-binding protein [Geobacteraceae bacterium]|nr:ABC transporter substrate-binding protein [Geobacteraceae bacterium]